MKYLLLALLAGMAMSGKSQRTTPATGGSYYGFPGERLPAVDTVPVYFLCGNKEPSGVAAWVFQRVGWIAERKVSDNYNESFWMEAVAYLQEDKKTLIPVDEIIWQSHPREVSKKSKP